MYVCQYDCVFMCVGEIGVWAGVKIHTWIYTHFMYAYNHLNVYSINMDI